MNANGYFVFQWPRCARGRLCRWCRLLALAACLSGAVGPSVAQISAPGAGASAEITSLNQLRLPPGSRQSLLADHLWIHGQPARVLVFEAPEAAVDLVRTLSRQQPALLDLNVLPGRLILSGQVGDDQWVAQLQSAGNGRTVGSISSLRVMSPPAEPRPAWLPEGARLRLDYAVMEAAIKVAERIWQHALPPAQLATVLEAGLLREGWTRLPEDGSAQVWARRGDRMRISLVPVDTGSGLRVREWTS